MIKVMGLEETKEYLKENLYEYDSYILPIDAAVKLGLIKPIPGRNDYFYQVEFKHESGCTMRVNKVYELTDEEMKKDNLWCRYRYETEVIDAPAGYGGSTLFQAGIKL